MCGADRETLENTRVTVLGLGAMGGALARALMAAGHDVTVWNRTAARSADLAQLGATVAGSPAEAISASPLTVMCVLDYQAVLAIFEQDGVKDALRGKVLAQLSTVTPDQADDLAVRASEYPATVLSGGIMAYPRSIGAVETIILYSGNREAFDKHAPTLRALAGSSRLVGDAARDAPVLYIASWSFYFAALGGFFEAAAFVTAAGARLEDLRGMTGYMLQELAGGLADAGRRIASGDFSGDQGTIALHVDGLASLCASVTSTGVPPAVLEAFLTHLRAAERAGRSHEDVASVYHALLPERVNRLN